MHVPNEIYEKALTLKPIQKAELIDEKMPNTTFSLWDHLPNPQSRNLDSCSGKPSQKIGQFNGRTCLKTLVNARRYLCHL